MTELEIYPLRAGYSGEAPPELVKAVRDGFIDDWDGLNWEALRQALREHGISGEELDSLTMMGVRMRCLFAAPKIRLPLGGTIATHTGTITRIECNKVAVGELAFAGDHDEPLLKASDPEARQFMHKGQWVTAEFALKRFDIKGPQLSKAATNLHCAPRLSLPKTWAGEIFVGLILQLRTLKGRQSRPNVADRGEFRSISAQSARTYRHGTGRTGSGAFAA